VKRSRLLPNLTFASLAAAAAVSWPAPRPGTLCAAGGALLLFGLGRRWAPPRWAGLVRALLPLSLFLLFADATVAGQVWRHPEWLALAALAALFSAWSAIERVRAGRRWLESDADRAVAALLLSAALCLGMAMGLLFARSTLPIPAGSAGVLAALAMAGAGWWGLRDETADEPPWPRVLALALAGSVLAIRAALASQALFG